MANNKTLDFSSYNFTNEDVVLLDTNIWLFLSPPPSSPKKHFVTKYTRACKNILTAKSKIIFDRTVLGEYMNRYCRIEWKAYQKKNSVELEFKEYRNLPDFQPVAESAAKFASQFIVRSRFVEWQLDQETLGSMLSTFSKGHADWSDLLLIDVCQRSNAMLVTDDTDFASAPVTILTCNPVLLNSFHH